MWHLAPLSTNEDLGTRVLLCGRSGDGRLRLSLLAFHALLGILEWAGGGMNTPLDPGKCTFNLGSSGCNASCRKVQLASVEKKY